MERLKALLESGALPFLITAGTSPKWSMVRVIESIIIAIIAGMMAAGASVYVTAKILENDMSHIMKTQEEIKQDNRNWYKEYRSEIKDVRKKVYNHVNNHTNDNNLGG